MIKSDLIAALATINDAELVFFRLPDGSVAAPASIEIQQEEPPIHALIVTEAVTKAALKRITDERQAARDRAEEEERRRLAEEEAVRAEADRAAADQAAALKNAVAEEVARVMAARLS